MFQQLEGLVASCDKIVLTLKAANGLMSVVVTPVVEKAADPALKHPFQLTGSAPDLDAHFARLLGEYVEKHTSLADQAAATAVILDEAKKAQTTKATGAIAKGAKRGASVEGSVRGDTEVDEAEEGDEADDEKSESARPASSPAPAAFAGTSMADLLG
jgi:PRTRC genetic system protein E